ncbi:MAG: DUF1343 domain-containing protein [Bacteroidetes bacterium SW_11_45_7]|nr:MAG: DUF1343 domain-containing protein [Bacteroidetes bacterium SW_11_45_7]
MQTINRLLIISILTPTILLIACLNGFAQIPAPADEPVKTGADQLSNYIDKLKDKKVGMVVNQTSEIDGAHLVDTLLDWQVDVETIFAPEHGFRGTADAGESVESGKDKKTGLPIVSLYGANKKASKEDIQGLELMVFDIQDVGARFYTYISTLHYVMEACAEHDVPLLVLDRPNPNGHYVDGPVLDTAFRSFVGMHPVPVVHGMTVGEYAQMINSEGWLEDQMKAELTVIKCKNYFHGRVYELPVRPSPNLPSMNSIYLYPSLCFFEGTVMSVGRGTDHPFEQWGHPAWPDSSYHFVPQPNEGASNPKYQGQRCYGEKLYGETSAPHHSRLGRINLQWLTFAYQMTKSRVDSFFTPYFDKLAGTDKLRQQIKNGRKPDQIRESWSDELDEFRHTRKQYLLYEVK